MKNFFSDDKVQEIKDNSDIVDVVASYLDLQLRGNSHKALCPFHNEKTPSFTVNQEKQIFKCFGCGEAGDVINFVMKIENLDFLEALKLLAERANIPMEKVGISDEGRKIINKKTLFFEINKIAGEYFYRNLTKERNQAISYLNMRGLKAKTIMSFGLGYALDSWNGLLEYLRDKGFSNDDIKECGLIKHNSDSKTYDLFRNRIMFPIFDIKSNVIGFGGRALDDTLPKYINSPETLVFYKSRVLYSLNVARKNVENRKIILVEGYMDVIVLNQEGIKNTVATLGTSLTKWHAQILKRYCDEVVICFDNDDAGKKAAMRSIDILDEAGVDVKICILKDGMDPDDFVRQKGKDAFKSLVDKAMDKIDYIVIMTKQKFDLNTSDGKIKFVREIANLAKRMKNSIESEILLQKIEKEIGVSYNTIKKELFRDVDSLKRPNKKYTSSVNRDNKYINPIPLIEKKGNVIAEKQFIKFLLTKSENIPKLTEKLEPKDFAVANHKEIVKYLYCNYKRISDSSHGDKPRGIVKDDSLETLSGIHPAPQGEQVSCPSRYKSLDIYALMEKIPTVKESVKEIMQMDIQHIDIEKNITVYVNEIKRNMLLAKEKELQAQQKLLLNANKHNKKEVEDKLLEIGMRILKINSEIQKLHHEGRRGF